LCHNFSPCDEGCPHDDRPAAKIPPMKIGGFRFFSLLNQD
jgi:hypothetical protein